MKTELLPWQQQIFNKITSGGVKPGEMMIISAGRQIGKSHFTQRAIDRLMRDLNSQPISDLVLSEGRVYGARYYCLEPVGGNWLEMETWCSDTYGNCGSAWDKDKTPEPNARWYMNDRRFWFREEKDRNWFVLKWSCL